MLLLQSLLFNEYEELAKVSLAYLNHRKGFLVSAKFLSNVLELFEFSIYLRLSFLYLCSNLLRLGTLLLYLGLNLLLLGSNLQRLKSDLDDGLC